MFYALYEKARATAYNCHTFLAGNSLVNSLLHSGKILRIDDNDLLISVCLEYILDFNGICDFTLESVAASGVILMSGHTRNMVIQHDRYHIGIVVNDLYCTGHSTVEKRGVTDNAEHFLFLLAGKLQSFCKTGTDRKATAHAYYGITGRQRSCTSEGIAPDITCNNIVFVL